MDEQKFQLREARDSLIDLLPIRSTYPLRNLPVAPKNPIVSYKNATSIIIQNSQPDVFYEIIDDEGFKFKPKVRGNNADLYIPTKDLTKEDYTFSVIATKERSRLKNVLLQTVTVQVGVDTSLTIGLTAEILDFNTVASMTIEATQPNGKYQAFDLNDQPVSEEVLSGEGGDLEVVTFPLKEDTEIKIKSTNLKTGLNDWMLQQLTPSVRPNLKVACTLKEATVAYGKKGTIVIQNSQSSTKYLLRCEWIDDDLADEAESDNKQLVTTKNGTDGILEVATSSLKEDIIVNILATKIKTGISEQLVARITVPIQPDPAKKLSIEEKEIDFSAGTLIKLSNTQRGIKYQLRNDVNNANISWPRYHSRNSGVGGAGVDVDFAVDQFSDKAVYLPTGEISKTKTFNVLAIKVKTKISVALSDTITVEVKDQ